MGQGHAGSGWLAISAIPLARTLATGRTRAVTSVRAYSTATDAELMAWSAGGDRHAFDRIVERHGLLALRVARRLIADPVTAEDIVQDAMVRAWSQAGRFDPERARFTTWLYRIVVNACIDHRRKRQLHPIPDHFDPVDPATPIDQIIEHDEKRSALADALADLPVIQRAAISLVYDEGLSGAETARVLGLSPKAVERLLARARAVLRHRLQSVST